MRVPGQNVHDFSITGAASTTVPLEIVNNHVYLSVTLDGRGPYTFVLDSGGDYIVTPDVARALQAKTIGGLQLQGVGSATEGAAFAHITSIAIGNAVIRNQYSLVLPIADRVWGCRGSQDRRHGRIPAVGAFSDDDRLRKL